MLTFKKLYIRSHYIQVMEESIRKYALQNAIQFNGVCNPGAVIGKLLAEDPSRKADMKDISQKVRSIVEEINSKSLEQQKEELTQLAPELLEKKKHEKREGLKPLPNVKDKVIMRLEPSPSGPLHIGHAYVGSLNAAYVKEHNGKLIIRISDTNPENIYIPAYEQIPEDSKWLWGDVEIKIQSDNMETYYEYAEKLFNKNAIYVCTCSQEDFKNLITNKQACPCRELPDQINRWKEMFNMKEGEAVVRFKSSVDDKNPAMRDFPLLRINESEHPKQKNKYKIWPLMNFSVAIDDLTMGITHSIRGKDHFDNEKRQRMIFEALEAEPPTSLFVGRINFEGFEVSCSKTKEKIEQGIYEGWDDIRVPFIPALKRRGYQPEAFIKYAIDVGVSLNDKTVHIDDFFKTINAFNKDILDSISNRYFFIENPKEITIEDAPEQELELDLHPDNKKGGRKFKTSNKFYITTEDFDDIKEGQLIRLMDCLNFTKKGDKFEFISLKYEDYKEKGDKIIHWLPVEKLQEVNVLLSDNTKIHGLAENNIKNIKINQVIQFERFAFCRLDNIDDKYQFWYTHK